MGQNGALSQIPFTWRLLPVLLDFRDYQVLVLALGHSSRKDDTESLIWLHKTPKGENTDWIYRKGVVGAAEVKVRTLRAMKAEALLDLPKDTKGRQL